MIQYSSVNFDGCGMRGMVSRKELAFSSSSRSGHVTARSTNVPKPITRYDSSSA